MVRFKCYVQGSNNGTAQRSIWLYYESRQIFLLYKPYLFCVLSHFGSRYYMWHCIHFEFLVVYFDIIIFLVLFHVSISLYVRLYSHFQYWGIFPCWTANSLFGLSKSLNTLHFVISLIVVDIFTFLRSFGCCGIIVFFVFCGQLNFFPQDINFLTHPGVEVFEHLFVRPILILTKQLNNCNTILHYIIRKIQIKDSLFLLRRKILCTESKKTIRIF